MEVKRKKTALRLLAGFLFLSLLVQSAGLPGAAVGVASEARGRFSPEGTEIQTTVPGAEGNSTGDAENFTEGNESMTEGEDGSRRLSRSQLLRAGASDHRRYMTGYPDGSFHPKENMTRAEAVAMLHNLLAAELGQAELGRAEFAPRYTDVPSEGWYQAALENLTKRGIVSGFPDGSFGPNRSMTRAEFAALISGFVNEPGEASARAFPDVQSDAWYYPHLQKALSHGWFVGDNQGKFRPEDPIIRAEVVCVMNKMLHRRADQGYVNRHPQTLTPFSDVHAKDWFFYHVAEATNHHRFDRLSNQNECWTQVYSD